MRKTLVILPLFIVCLIYWSPVKGYNSVLDDEYLLRDTTLSQVFESERELSLFIVEELELKESVDELDRQEIDSLHQVMGHTALFDKDITNKELNGFNNFNIDNIEYGRKNILLFKDGAFHIIKKEDYYDL